jgi:hypothetical protein
MFVSNSTLLKGALMAMIVASSTNVTPRDAMIHDQNIHMSMSVPRVGNESMFVHNFKSGSVLNSPLSMVEVSSVSGNLSSSYGKVGCRLIDRPLVTSDCNFTELLKNPISHYTTVPVARVTECLDVWKKELQNDVDKDFILNGIGSGFSIVDCEVSKNATYRRNYKSTQLANKQKVENRILEQIESGHYIISEAKPLKISALGAVPKDISDVCVIHDLSRPDGGVNKFAKETSVTYTTLDKAVNFISPSAFLAKLDLAAAYRSIPISEDCYELTGMQWKFQGHNSPTNLFDCRLPFGAAMSCNVFQRITDSISRIMERKGFTIIPYLDDMLCIGESELSCRLCLDTLIDLVESLGLRVNWKKVSGPARKLVFLGINVDCENRTLSLSSEKNSKLKELLVSKLMLQKLIGKLSWASRVVRGGRTFLRRLLDLLCGLKESHHHVRINSAARGDLLWWDQCLDLFHGYTPFKVDIPLPSYIFATDVCEQGGGGTFGHDWFYVSCCNDVPAMLGHHINELELYTVFLALKRWGPAL